MLGDNSGSHFTAGISTDYNHLFRASAILQNEYPPSFILLLLLYNQFQLDLPMNAGSVLSEFLD